MLVQPCGCYDIHHTQFITLCQKLSTLVLVTSSCKIQGQPYHCRVLHSGWRQRIRNKNTDSVIEKEKVTCRTACSLPSGIVAMSTMLYMRWHEPLPIRTRDIRRDGWCEDSWKFLMCITFATHAHVASHSSPVVVLYLAVHYKLYMKQLDSKLLSWTLLLSMESGSSFRLIKITHRGKLSPFSTNIFMDSSRRPRNDMHYSTCGLYISTQTSFDQLRIHDFITRSNMGKTSSFWCTLLTLWVLIQINLILIIAAALQGCAWFRWVSRMLSYSGMLIIIASGDCEDKCMQYIGSRTPDLLTGHEIWCFGLQTSVDSYGCTY